MATKKKDGRIKFNIRPIIFITLISLLLCGFMYPLFVTGIGQILFPLQANGDIIQLNGRPIGSELIAQTFTSPIFFQPRNDSASGVDPHITLENAYSQIPIVANSTGIPESNLKDLVDANKEGTFWIFGKPYVNVLRLNLLLIQLYPSVYDEFLR